MLVTLKMLNNSSEEAASYDSENDSHLPEVCANWINLSDCEK